MSKLRTVWRAACLSADFGRWTTYRPHWKTRCRAEAAWPPCLASQVSAKLVPPKSWPCWPSSEEPWSYGAGATKARGRTALLALGPLDTIGHLLGDANRDPEDSTISDRHASLQGL